MAEDIKRTKNYLDSAIKGLYALAQFIRDVGMPIAAFALGAYILVGQQILGETYIHKDIIGLILIGIGVISQMWIYSRENPPKRSNELIEHLKEITTIIETLRKG